MTPPKGRLDFTFNFAAKGTEAEARPASRVGHLVFIAPYSATDKSLDLTTNFVLRPLQLGEGAFCVARGAIQIEPVAGESEPFLLPLLDADSLHPDSILDTVPGLSELWEPLREFDQSPSAIKRLGSLVACFETGENSGENTSNNGTNPGPESKGPKDSGTISEAKSRAKPAEETGELLDRLLGQRSSEGSRSTTSQGGSASIGGAQELVRQFAARALKGEASTQRHGPLEISGDLRRKAETELGRRLRELLQQETFRAVEGAWLATEMVVRACPDESRARFSAVDASWSELVTKPLAFDTLLEQGVSVVVIDHCFCADPNELQSLVSLVRACHERQVFLVTGAAPSLAGLEESFLKNPTGTKHDVEAWQEDWTFEAREAWGQLATLREHGAQFAFVLPRCLVRYPYGKLGLPLEKFDFEELENGAGPEQFLWVNGAYLVARALMEQWCGGEPLTDGSFEIGGLPVASVMDVDGRRVQPPLELSFPRAVVDQLLDQGFSFIEAWRDTDRARVHV